MTVESDTPSDDAPNESKVHLSDSEIFIFVAFIIQSVMLRHLDKLGPDIIKGSLLLILGRLATDVCMYAWSLSLVRIATKQRSLWRPTFYALTTLMFTLGVLDSASMIILLLLR